jgi:hypothetical protein
MGNILCITRQSCAIEFHVKLGKDGQETLELIQQVYGPFTVSRPTMIFRWWKHLKNGKITVTDDQ